MTDVDIRTRMSAVVRARLAAGSQEIMSLYGDLVANRGKNCADHFLTIHQLGLRGGSAEEIGTAIDVLIQSHPENREPPIVISLHGIFTTGAWQKKLAPIVTRAHMVPEPFDYGFLFPHLFLIPWIRARRVEQFFKDYTEVRRLHPDADISICAHSFGTYILGYAMWKYNKIKFSQVILCGSILPIDFPWDQFLKNNQVQRVLNEFGGKDSWARRVRRGVKDAGPSGYIGFTITHPCFFQRSYPLFKHSDFFNPLQFEESWLPFLTGAQPSSSLISYSPPQNRQFRYTMFGLILLVVLLWIFGPYVWRLLFH